MFGAARLHCAQPLKPNNSHKNMRLIQQADCPAGELPQGPEDLKPSTPPTSYRAPFERPVSADGSDASAILIMPKATCRGPCIKKISSHTSLPM